MNLCPFTGIILLKRTRSAKEVGIIIARYIDVPAVKHPCFDAVNLLHRLQKTQILLNHKPRCLMVLFFTWRAYQRHSEPSLLGRPLGLGTFGGVRGTALPQVSAQGKEEHHRAVPRPTAGLVGLWRRPSEGNFRTKRKRRLALQSIFIFVSSALRCAAGMRYGCLPAAIATCCSALHRGARVMLFQACGLAAAGGEMEKLLFKAQFYVTIERKEGSKREKKSSFNFHCEKNR